jgi:predicted metal-dependent enzyme (double-stranded beta helix superfamily)
MLTLVSNKTFPRRYVCFYHVGMAGGRINTIRELVQELLRHREAAAFPQILARYEGPSHDLEPYFRWNSRHYTRTCIHRNREFELLVICYEPGQRTSIHDYDSQTAWIHPVMGEVVEERFSVQPGDGVRPVGEKHLRPGTDDSLTNGNTIHRFTNRGSQRAVTLNLYARPMSKWRVFDEHTGAATIAPAGPPH